MTDVADAMILGRLFEKLFALGVVIVATSNTPPQRLYEGGLNRGLFLPFIAMIEERMQVIELDGGRDYRLERMGGLNVYITPLGPEADAAMDAAWQRLTDAKRGVPDDHDRSAAQACRAADGQRRGALHLRCSCAVSRSARPTTSRWPRPSTRS